MPNFHVSDPYSKRILLVDDEPTILEMLADSLRKAGYEVGTSTDGLDALQKFRNEAWDLVVTDRGMPRMDGHELADAIKGIAPGVPVILITGLPATIRETGRFDAVLCKPFQGRDILTLISDVLTRDPQRSGTDVREEGNTTISPSEKT
jgi:DNA-binding response OmpR family regulator